MEILIYRHFVSMIHKKFQKLITIEETMTLIIFQNDDGSFILFKLPTLKIHSFKRSLIVGFPQHNPDDRTFFVT